MICCIQRTSFFFGFFEFFNIFLSKFCRLFETGTCFGGRACVCSAPLLLSARERTQGRDPRLPRFFARNWRFTWRRYNVRQAKECVSLPEHIHEEMGSSGTRVRFDARPWG